jgi:hypothetical protein
MRINWRQIRIAQRWGRQTFSLPWSQALLIPYAQTSFSLSNAYSGERTFSARELEKWKRVNVKSFLGSH